MTKFCFTSTGLPSTETLERIGSEARNSTIAIIAHGYDKRGTAHPDRAADKRRFQLEAAGFSALHFNCYEPSMRGKPFTEKAAFLSEHSDKLRSELASFGILYLLGGDLDCTMTYRRVLRQSGIEEIAQVSQDLIIIAESLGAIMCSPSLEGIGLAGCLDADTEKLWEGMRLTDKRPIPHSNWKMPSHRRYGEYIQKTYPTEALPLYDRMHANGPYEYVAL